MLVQYKDLVSGQIYKPQTGYSIFRHTKASELKCLVIEETRFRNLSNSESASLETTQDEKDWYNYCETFGCIPFSTFLQQKAPDSLTIQLYPLLT